MHFDTPSLNCFFLKKCCGIKDNTIILHIFFNMNKNAIMSRFIEYSNNILLFDVMFGETLNEETRCSKCVHPFLRMQYTILR